MSWPYLARGGGQVEMEACTPSRKACLGLGEGSTAPTDAAWRHPEHQDWEPPPEHPLPTHHPAPGPQPSLRIVFLCPLLLASLTRPGAGRQEAPEHKSPSEPYPGMLTEEASLFPCTGFAWERTLCGVIRSHQPS